jgi:hypothetical protein
MINAMLCVMLVHSRGVLLMLLHSIRLAWHVYTFVLLDCLRVT